MNKPAWLLILASNILPGGAALAQDLVVHDDSPALTVPKVWLAEIRADGAVAFREGAALTLRKDEPGAALGSLGRFAGADFGADGLERLRASMKKSLVNHGLFADEAEAMLETWKKSYFEKPGLRVFYVAPREWIDHFLPLELSVPARVERVFVGRIDLGPRDIGR